MIRLFNQKILNMKNLNTGAFFIYQNNMHSCLELLHHIEHRTGKKVNQLFDLVVGTSTGAILAALLCLEGLGAREALQLYKCLGKRVFHQTRLRGAGGLLVRQSYYDSSQLEAELQQHFGSASLGDTLGSQGVPHLALVASRAILKYT